MGKAIICGLLFLCIYSNAQVTITGIVLNDKDRKPVEAASVYINGTTSGTYTDLRGHFILKNVAVPCQIVVSHLMYKSEHRIIQRNTDDTVTILLTEKCSQLSGVSVSGKNKRKNIIREFKEVFFGDDKWGRNAILENDSVLYFTRRIDTVARKSTYLDFYTQKKSGKINSHDYWSKDSTRILSNLQVLSAKSKSPLQIDLPLLGYRVYLDLVSFNIVSNAYWRDCSYWAYYHFLPYTTTTPIKQAQFERNRQAVYYNSSKHFCQSLYDNKLKENGYLIAFKTGNKVESRIISRFIDIGSYIQYTNQNEMKITGLKDKDLCIYYFCNYDGSPIDLTRNCFDIAANKNVWQSWDYTNESLVTFTSDTCTIRSNGTIPDTNILFDGKIASKRGGALLPDDYLPQQSTRKMN